MSDTRTDVITARLGEAVHHSEFRDGGIQEWDEYPCSDYGNDLANNDIAALLAEIEKLQNERAALVTGLEVKESVEAALRSRLTITDEVVERATKAMMTLTDETPTWREFYSKVARAALRAVGMTEEAQP